MSAKKNLKAEVSESKEQKILAKIAEFFVNNRKIILICLAALVVALIAIVVIVSSIQSASDKKMIGIVALEERYNALLVADNTAETYQADFDSLVADLSAMVKGSSYPSIKASYLLGLIYYDSSSYQEAIDAFVKASELGKGTYLETLSLVNAAVCQEELGNTEIALDLFNQVAEDTSSAVAPKALFNAGRIYQEQGNAELAKSTFQQIVDYYPNSEYGKLAINLVNVM